MVDDLFHIIDSVQVVLRIRGVFFQRDVFYRGDRLYAHHGGGYIRLGEGDATSAPAVSWESLDVPDYLKGNFSLQKFNPPIFTL